MLDVAASYGTLLDLYGLFLGIFIHYSGLFISEVLYLHQIFTDYVSYQYIHFYMLICQI